jgi:hypothetical protein
MFKTTLPVKFLAAYKTKLVIEPKLAKQMRHFVKECPQECQWYTFITRTEENGCIVFTCSGDILIPPQKIGPKDVDMDSIGVVKMWREEEAALKAADPSLTDTQVDTIINQSMAKAYMWCHSHVSMGITPSPTDNSQWETWVKLHDQSGTPEHPPGMLILNKADEMFVRIYDPVTKIQFENIVIEVPTVFDPELTIVNEALKTKLSKIEEKPKEVKTKPTTISPNPHYQQHLGAANTWGMGAPTGGSSGLRGAIQEGINTHIGGGPGKTQAPLWGQHEPHQTAGKFTSKTYQILSRSDVKVLSEALDDAFPETKDTPKAKKVLNNWLQTNLKPGSWKSIYDLIDLYKTGVQDLNAYLKPLIFSNPAKDPTIEETITELVQFDGETGRGLDLLDAVAAYEQVGKDLATPALIAAFSSTQSSAW